MEEVDGYLKERKIMNNDLYCITVKSGQEHLDESFTIDCLSYLDSDDGNYIAGFDINDESIYFVFIDEWKVEKMINFFKENNILIKFEKVSNIINFINSDKKYLEVYSEEHNRVVLNNYIKYHITVDNVLDRMYQNKDVKGFSLFPVEMEILLLETA